MNRYSSILSIKALSREVKGAAFKNAVTKISIESLVISPNDLNKLISYTKLDERLKDAFWNEYSRAKEINEKMDLKNVYGELCSYTHWHTNILGNELKLLWILSPIRELSSEILSLKYSILREMKRILDIPISDKNGVFDYQIMEAKFNIFKSLLDVDKSCSYNSTGA
ncbi:hypothetical protein N9O57_00860 [bacterium]|nr:hypothetical protein [bacterium]